MSAKRHRVGKGTCVKLRVKSGLSGRLLGTGVNEATRWPTETWSMHPPGDPYAATAQVTLFKDKGEWQAWTGNIWREEPRKNAQALARARNRCAT
jgi:hypothetical protein